MTSSPKIPPAGADTRAPLPGRGLDAAAAPAQAAAARPVTSTPPGDGPGNHRPAGEACHPLASPAASPAPGSPQFAGAGGQVEPPSLAPAPAGPGMTVPGPAPSSPLAPRGRAGGGQSPVPGGRPVLRGAGLTPEGAGARQTAALSGPDPGGVARSSAAAPPGATPGAADPMRPVPAVPGPLTGPAAREAWRKALSGQAADRRRSRGKWPVKRAGGRYAPGSARRMPGGGT